MDARKPSRDETDTKVSMISYSHICTSLQPQGQECEVTITLSLLHLAVVENRPKTLVTLLKDLKK